MEWNGKSCGLNDEEERKIEVEGDVLGSKMQGRAWTKQKYGTHSSSKRREQPMSSLDIEDLRILATHA